MAGRVHSVHPEPKWSLTALWGSERLSGRAAIGMIPLLSSKNVPMYACENLRGEGSSFFKRVLGMTSQIHVKMEQREKKKHKIRRENGTGQKVRKSLTDAEQTRRAMLAFAL